MSREQHPDQGPHAEGDKGQGQMKPVTDLPVPHQYRLEIGAGLQTPASAGGRGTIADQGIYPGRKATLPLDVRQM